MIVPVTSTDYGLASHAEIAVGESGLEHVSNARCNHIRVLSTARIPRRLGHIASEELRTVGRALRFIVDL